MTERGMIFNGEMVRAILDGRKTQTRRVVKFKPREPGLNLNFSGLKLGHYRTGDASGGYVLASRGAMGCWNDKTYPVHCPYGQPGDRIWVRETFSAVPDHDEPAGCSALLYAADGNGPYGKWTPSIHMPRWASRILLKITDVRVERLNSISEEDAKAEGVPTECCVIGYKHFLGFRSLWKAIYGDESWQANPWVWVIEFKRIEGDDNAID
ncbi:TPA: hypothetical protein ACUK8L_000530 [Escherichia coli]|uniref:hypothetical protein n=1 Tax=Escherichia coli TaxID=562 RepID=UPI000B507AB8|nr:hypothetical protein [Escherichia coli]EIL3224640.1 hypothetical protein [Escherichia coli]ELM8972687.1 hypothetical protein [Escherichia coli]BEA10517.1 hypothetical protein VEE26_10240 [Escherichia coli]HBC8136039.1 hypothetical protein [Escherichia coli]